MKKDKRFEVVYQEGGFMGAKTIYVDKETGVNYLFIVSGYAGGLTPLLDAEGKAGHHKRVCRLIKPRFLSGAIRCKQAFCHGREKTGAAILAAPVSFAWVSVGAQPVVT